MARPGRGAGAADNRSVSPSELDAKMMQLQQQQERLAAEERQLQVRATEEC